MLSYKYIGPFFFGISLAFLGGAFSYLIGLPLPWMLGPLLSIGIFSALNFNIKIPDTPRPICRAILGCAIGANFTTEVSERVGEIGISIIILPVFLFIMILVTSIYLKKIMKYDLKTSIFGSIPGGLNEMVIIGKEIGVNPRTMILIHSTRIVVVVIIASIIMHFFSNQPLINSLNSNLFNNVSDLPNVFIVCFFGYYIGKVISLPGYTITGPMILSAMLHVLGIIDAMPMNILIIIVQIILGGVLGSQFRKVSSKDLYGPVLCGIITTFISFIPLSFFVLLLSKIGYELNSIILSYAPGGQSEMNLLSLSAQADMAFISTHHIFRVFIVIMLAAIIQKIIKKINVD